MRLERRPFLFCGNWFDVEPKSDWNTNASTWKSGFQIMKVPGSQGLEHAGAQAFLFSIGMLETAGAHALQKLAFDSCILERLLSRRRT